MRKKKKTHSYEWHSQSNPEVPHTVTVRLKCLTNSKLLSAYRIKELSVSTNCPSVCWWCRLQLPGMQERFRYRHEYWFRLSIKLRLRFPQCKMPPKRLRSYHSSSITCSAKDSLCSLRQALRAPFRKTLKHMKKMHQNQQNISKTICMCFDTDLAPFCPLSPNHERRGAALLLSLLYHHS